MKALTVSQPWAWAIIHGTKRIENRTWSVNYRGPLAIHAGKSTSRLCATLPDGTPVPMDELVFGAVLGVVDLVACVRLKDAPKDVWVEGPFCWLLANPRRFVEPLVWQGQRMLYDIPEAVIEGKLCEPSLS